MSAPLKVFLIATEESGDRLGAALMRALVERAGRPVEFAGVGGGDMAAAGIQTLFPIEDLAIVGIDAVLAKLPLILRRIRETAAAVIAVRPDVLVIIDSPDFTHRVAKRVRAKAPHIPIVDYVSPTVWAWRPGRARKMRAYVDRLLALLPFEPKVHEALGGPVCTYVGHPIGDRLKELRPDAAESRRRETDPPVLLVLPGSRTGEVTRLLPPFGETVRRVVAQCGAMEVIVPTVPHVAARVREAVAGWGVPTRVTLDPVEKATAFRTARAALAASGTVTLELAVAGIPTVVAYKISLLEEAVGHLFVRTPTIVLANLVLGENVIPEVLQRRATPENLTAALVQVIGDTPARARQVEAFARLDGIMGFGELSPGIAAADIVLAVAGRGGTGGPEKPS
jgi:lipid-A-disaccharide synthase